MRRAGNKLWIYIYIQKKNEGSSLRYTHSFAVAVQTIRTVTGSGKYRRRQWHFVRWTSNKIWHATHNVISRREYREHCDDSVHRCKCRARGIIIKRPVIFLHLFLQTLRRALLLLSFSGRVTRSSHAQSYIYIYIYIPPPLPRPLPSTRSFGNKWPITACNLNSPPPSGSHPFVVSENALKEPLSPIPLLDATEPTSTL